MNKITFNQYREPVPGVFRPGEPKCPFIAAIPTLTVTNVEGLKGLADCLVHVTDTNTTYYIDDKHRVTITWAGPVEIDDYDYEANPKNIRSGEVWDFKNNRIIIYDAVGNYAIFTSSIDDFNQLRNRPKYAGQEMTGDTDIPDVAAIEAAVAGIDSAINKVVMTDLVLDANPSTTTVQLDSTKTNIKTSASTTENIPLPVASTTQAGVMNSATYNAVTHNTSDINALMNGAVAIAGISATPTQSDLTTAWESETGLSQLMNRASIYDIDNDKIWTYYANTDTWYPSANTPSITINTFTNNSEGTIKGSTNVGQVFAENDGTGSVNGWDTLSSTVADHTSTLSGLATVATSGSYLDLTDTPTDVSAFTNDAGYLTLDSQDAEIGEVIYTWIASNADTSEARIPHYIPLDLTTYRKIVVEASWTPTRVQSDTPEWSRTRFWSSTLDDPDQYAIPTLQIGTEWKNNQQLSIIRNDDQVVAAGVLANHSVEQYIEIYSAAPGTDYITFRGMAFGGEPQTGGKAGAQLTQGRVNGPVSSIKSFKLPVYFPSTGSWIKAYGYKR